MQRVKLPVGSNPGTEIRTSSLSPLVQRPKSLRYPVGLQHLQEIIPVHVLVVRGPRLCCCCTVPGIQYLSVEMKYLKETIPTIRGTMTTEWRGFRARKRYQVPVRTQPFRTAVPIWGLTIQSLSSLSPKRDCSPKREWSSLRGRWILYML